MIHVNAGVLVVDRGWLLDKARSSGMLHSRKPEAFGMGSGEDTFQRYRGFDGLAWPGGAPRSIPVVEGLAEIDLLRAAVHYASVSGRGWDVVVLSAMRLDMEVVVRQHLVFRGFDVGFFESEWSHFSSLLNECLFGSNERLRSFAARLNSSMLFANEADAGVYLNVRDEMARSGVSLESGPPMIPYAIYSEADDPALGRRAPE